MLHLFGKIAQSDEAAMGGLIEAAAIAFGRANFPHLSSANFPTSSFATAAAAVADLITWLGAGYQSWSGDYNTM